MQGRNLFAGADEFVLLRWLVVGTQATTILITWPLWQIRSSPPMLPVVEGPPIDFTWLLLGSLLLVLIHPKAGVVLHASFLAMAMLFDQMRLQPEFISQAILLWGTLPHRSARTICRAHLIALWFFGGFHKLVSPDFYSGDAQWLVTSFLPQASAGFAAIVGASIALGEIALAITAVIPSTRQLAGYFACLMHLGIVVILSIGIVWDEAVWPWNTALAVAGFVMIGSWQSDFRAQLKQVPVWTRGAVAFVLLSPFAYYPGRLDTYLCHLLYSSHVPLAWIHSADGDKTLINTRPQLKVPVPQVHRLYEQYFARVSQPGDSLEIYDPRWWYRWKNNDQRIVTYEQLRGRLKASAN